LISLAKDINSFDAFSNFLNLTDLNFEMCFTLPVFRFVFYHKELFSLNNNFPCHISLSLLMFYKNSIPCLSA